MVKINSTTARAIARAVRLDCRRRTGAGGSGGGSAVRGSWAGVRAARRALARRRPGARLAAPGPGPRIARPDGDWTAPAQALNLGKADAPA